MHRNCTENAQKRKTWYNFIRSQTKAGGREQFFYELMTEYADLNLHPFNFISQGSLSITKCIPLGQTN